MSAGKATKCLASEVGRGVKATGLAEKQRWRDTGSENAGLITCRKVVYCRAYGSGATEGPTGGTD